MLIFFCIVVLCITMIAFISVVAIFCYRQDNMKMLFESKTTANNDGITSEFKVDIDKTSQKRE